MSTLRPSELIEDWRKRAEFLADYGDPNSARLWNLAATELARALEALGEETLDLQQAARASGYTADHLGSLFRRGKIPNLAIVAVGLFGVLRTVRKLRWDI